MTTKILTALACVALLAGCKDDVKPDTAAPAKPSGAPALTAVAATTLKALAQPVPTTSAAMPAGSAKVATKLDQLLALDSIDRAIAFSKADFTDGVDETSSGATLFAAWAAKKLTWKDVALDKDETDLETALKAPNDARGKRLCAKGLVSKIEEEKGSVPSSSGILLTGKKEVVHFLAVGPMGEVAAKKSAKLCGVFIGKYDYKNSSGEQSHASQVVGLFETAAAPAGSASASPATSGGEPPKPPAASAAPKK